MLHDLFPVDGGAPSPRLSVNASSQVTNSSIRVARSATIPPVTRTGTGSGTGGSVRRPPSLAASESSYAPAEPSIKPRSKWKGATAATLVLAAGGFFVWKGVLKKKLDDEGGARMTQVSDPARRFHVYVKSEPPGADVFIEGEAMPIGETPVTLPIDLTGKNSVKLILRKDGYEDYDQRVINEMPLSINLKKRETAEPAKPAEPTPPPAPPAGAVPADDSTGAADDSGRTHRHASGKKAAHKPASPGAPPTPAEVDE
jgi:hypothetical protein